MHGPEKSDSVVVAVKPMNKAERSVAELVDPRTGTQGNDLTLTSPACDRGFHKTTLCDQHRWYRNVRSREKLRVRQLDAANDIRQVSTSSGHSRSGRWTLNRRGGAGWTFALVVAGSLGEASRRAA